MTSEAKWEALEGMILLGKAESDRIIKDSTESSANRHFNLYRLDVLKEVEAWMEELNDTQADEKEDQRAKERQERIEARKDHATRY